MYDMTGWTPDVSQWTLVSVGFVQGAGLGFLFVPLTTIAFATLPAQMRGEGTGLYNLSRNIGSSVGISVVSALITENTQVNHLDDRRLCDAVQPCFRCDGRRSSRQTPSTLAGRAALDGIDHPQATIIAYMDDFKLLMILCIVAMPFLALLVTPKREKAPSDDHTTS